MGLDIGLGAVILLGALRGWFRGFTTQAVRLVGLVSCVYLALPVREQVRPYVLAKMPNLEIGLLDRMLWWLAAVVSYIVLVGLITLSIQLMRTPPEPGTIKTRRGDRFAGLLLGAAKATVIAAFLAAGVQKYGQDITRNISWAERQCDGSHALAWTAKFQPVPRLWSTPPVRSFVEQFQRNGLKSSPESQPEKQLAERIEDPADTFNRPPRLDLPPAELPDPGTWEGDSDLGEDVVRDLEKIKQELEAQRPRS